MSPAQEDQAGAAELERLRAALRERDERLRVLGEVLLEGATYQIDTGIDGTTRRCTHFSPGMERIYGVPAADVLRDAGHLYRLIHPDDAPRLAALEAEALARHTRFDAEGRIIRPSGEIRWVRCNSVPRRREDGHLVWDGFASDITVRKLREEEEIFRLALVDIAAAASDALNTAADDRSFDAALTAVLGRLAGLQGVDRAYVFLFSGDLERMSNTHEWCAAGVAAQMERIQDLPAADLPWFMRRIREGRMVEVPDVEALPAEAAGEQAEFRAQEIRSLACFPFLDAHGRLTGFMGFDAVRGRRSWPPDQAALLQFVADKLGSLIERRRAELAAHRAEEEIRRREGILRAVLDAVPEGIVAVDLGTRRAVYANPPMGRLLGRDLAEFPDLTPAEVHPAGALPEVQRQYEEALAGHRSFAPDIPVLRKDGSVFDAEIRCVMVAIDGRPCLLNIFTDITARKRAEADRRRHELRHRDYIERSPIAIIVADNDGAFLEANPATCRLSGYALEELTALRVGSMVHPDHRGKALALFQRVREYGYADAEYPIVTKTGGVRQMLVVAVRISDSHIAAFAIDVTARHLHEESLRQAAAAAAAASELKSQFVANISHEIRTPLNGIIGTADLLLLEDLDGRQRELAGIIAQSGQHLLALLNDVLDFARLERGGVVLEAEDLDLRDLLASSLAAFAALAETKGLALASACSPSVPRSLRGDRVRLAQVLMNLVGNAVKFTERGSVTVSADAGDGTGHLVLAVRDTGVGIPPERLDALFQPFTQADGSISRRYGGSGLGLAISGRLVELMGGAIAIDSTPGLGTTVRVELPLVSGGAGEARPAGLAAPAPAATPPRRILIVEDNRINSLVLSRMCATLGHACDVAPDGRQALERMRAGDYDLVFMDVQMPVLDGCSAARLVRDPASGVRDPRVPIVALTANAMDGDREACLAAGMDDYLSKPVTITRLREAIARWTVRQPAGDR